jgi:hypothetical protein
LESQQHLTHYGETGAIEPAEAGGVKEIRDPAGFENALVP